MLNGHRLQNFVRKFLNTVLETARLYSTGRNELRRMLNSDTEGSMQSGLLNILWNQSKNIMGML